MNLLRRVALQLLLIIVFVPGISSGSHADVYEWSDGGGRHFSDSLEVIPKEFRDQARLLVREPSPGPAPAAPPPTPEAAETEDESAMSFTAGWDRGFEAGWAAGFQAAAEQQPVCTTEPEVIVLESAPVPVPIPRYDTVGGYYLSPYAGTVTAPFDGGRSRGLTRREQMQRLQGR